MQLCSSLNFLWRCLSLGLEWKLTFSSPVATAEFSQFSGILSAALSQHHLSGFEIAQLFKIPSPPLALFIAMLPKAHLTSHSRMSGSRWVITPSWLSGSCTKLVEFMEFQLSYFKYWKMMLWKCCTQYTSKFGKLRRKWQPTPVLLPGKSHGQRSVVGYSPRGRKESDTTEWLHFTSAVATGLEKLSFHSNPKERQCQRMVKLLHNCTHLTR